MSQGLFENQNPNDERSSKPSSDIDFSYFYENGGINLDESIIEPEFVYLQKELLQLLKLNKEAMLSSILKSSIQIPIAKWVDNNRGFINKNLQLKSENNFGGVINVWAEQSEDLKTHHPSEIDIKFIVMW